MSRRVLTFLVAILMAVVSVPAADAAKGAPGPPDGKGEDTTPNSLSVPAVIVGNTNTPFTCVAGAEGAVMPTGATLTWPGDFDNPILTPPEGGTLPPAGEYFIQGVNSWRAECANAGDLTVHADADWGDNLGGDANLSVGSPVRVEMGLLVSDAAYADMMGFKVVKLTEDLDRNATYGTLGAIESEDPFSVVGILEDLGEVRAYDDGAWLTITYIVVVGEETTETIVVDEAFGAELNATGRIVYGYNWVPEDAGTYRLTFEAPSVYVNGAADQHSASIQVTVAPQTGHGGGGGGPGGPRTR